MAWTEQMVDDLRAMWKEGLTTAEIGKRLGVSKNSIVGKVHRLGLSGRPSPIKKKEEVENPVVEAKPLPTKKAEKVKSEPVPASKKVEEPKEEKIEIKVAKQPETPRKEHVSLVDLDNHTCRWPIGDPKDENFHFCGKKVKIGQTYCEEHANIAYVKAIKK